MKETKARLDYITRDCRDDMHEPDEQEVSCQVVGTELDNACGESIELRALERGYQELVVILRRETEDGAEVQRFNLATLIALARKAGEPL
jgi:hypothetical protein